MKAKHMGFSQRRMAILTPLWAIILTFTWFALSSKDTRAQDKKHENFDADNFDNPTQIDNNWMPLKPGMRYVYAGTTIDDQGEAVPHRVVINVTDLTKVIEGIRCRVSWDLDYSSGELVEAELAFFAQDNDGNVWRMGEIPVEYEDGEVADAPCWISGIKGSVAGISMRAEPKVGARSYSQGWAPSVGFTDRGQVDQMGITTCVPMKCYEDVLVVAEGSEAEPDAQQLKYFAHGVGNIKVGWRGEGEKTQEVLRLVDVMQLGADGLAKMRKQAMKLEKLGYEISKDVYGKTPPLKQDTGTN